LLLPKVGFFLTASLFIDMNKTFDSIKELKEWLAKETEIADETFLVNGYYGFAVYKEIKTGKFWKIEAFGDCFYDVGNRFHAYLVEPQTVSKTIWKIV